MIDSENAIKGLEETKIMLDKAVDRGGEMSVIQAYKCFNHVFDALVILKEQEAMMQCIKRKCCICPHCANCDVDNNCLLKEQEAKWIYGEDETGVDGWRCSKCNFFEPWFYEFDNDIDFIKHYEHCPKCGRRMTSYTGKQMVVMKEVNKNG